jgi:hypothetical protein
MSRNGVAGELAGPPQGKTVDAEAADVPCMRPPAGGECLMGDYFQKQHAREKVWLASLKEGDTVVRRYGWNGVDLVKVTHVTPTQIVCGTSRYRRKDGSPVGNDGYNAPRIFEFTEEVRVEIREKELRRAIELVKWKEVSAGCVEAVLKLVEADRPAVQASEAQ